VNRAARRRLKKKNGGNEKLAQKISSFEHRPDACSACSAPFDAKSKEHAQTWRVVVREKPTRVSLFCPQCIEKTKEILDDYSKTEE
jgi:hypothetical protein|tara:strand:- start:7119 stop:7376 length:258 start_codon:yes stop_codon:yes gene_type:complete